MALRTDQSLRATTGLFLRPEVLQSIQILQLPNAEMSGLIELELGRNETLEVCAPRDEAPAGERDRADRPAATGQSDFDGKRGMLENVADESGTLIEHLREQVAWWDLEPCLRDDVLALVERLDERGYLIASDAELLEVVHGGSLHAALDVLRSLEPAGVGARNATDALLLQVAAGDPDRELLGVLLTEHLAALAAGQMTEIAKLMGVRVEEVQRLVERIRELDPHPVSRFTGEAARPVTPDLVVCVRDGDLDVRVWDTDLPSLGVNEDYAAMVVDPLAAPEVVSYLRPKLDSARHLISAIEQRRKTLARVGAAILHHQRPFLIGGEASLRPLKMADIATMLGMHTSTVSRAVAGKYVQTDRGVYPLREFFDGGRSRGLPGGGQGVGRRGVQQRLRELVDGEPSGRPYSDDDLVTLLAARGLQVARRTVTKYRKELGIPSSWKRRQP